MKVVGLLRKRAEFLDRVEYWIWLQQALGPGSPRADLLVKRLGGIERVYKAGVPDYYAIPGLTAREISNLRNKSLDKPIRIIENCMKRGYQILTPADRCYPQRLRDIYAPPCVLYVWGELAPVDDAVLIAMVGTRQLSDYGLAAATKLSMGLAAYGAVVVSGLAVGADTASHKGALKGNGKTYAVIGCGLDVPYPSANQELKRLISKNGAVVSEYPPGTRPNRMNFPIRNRIIAGLSLGTVVVEAGSKSGSLITANLAADMGRDVFAVPGSIFSPMSEGTNRLLKDGVKPVCSVLDILEEYIEFYPQSINRNTGIKTENVKPVKTDAHDNLSHEKIKSPVPGKKKPAALKDDGQMVLKPSPPGLSGQQLIVYQTLGKKPVHVDQIALLTNLEPKVVLSALTSLEIQGFARSFPGRRFTVV